MRGFYIIMWARRERVNCLVLHHVNLACPLCQYLQIPWIRCPNPEVGEDSPSLAYPTTSENLMAAFAVSDYLLTPIY